MAKHWQGWLGAALISNKDQQPEFQGFAEGI